jgi:hypothetical protein
MKVVIAPGAFEDDITLEEQEKIIKMFLEALENGTLEADSEPVDFDKLAEEDPEAYEHLMEQIESEAIEDEGQIFEVETSFGQTKQ